jgi:HD-GYP domain-containing protein (c-di-GMP phosphodiesterase class II)
MIGSELIGKIPRLENVAKIICYQEKCYDGSGVPKDAVKGKDIPLGARILKVSIDFDTFKLRFEKDRKAFEMMKLQADLYDPQILEVLQDMIIGTEKEEITQLELTIDELKEGMLLAEDVRTKKGQLLITKGNTVSNALIERLKNFAVSVGVKEPIVVYAPGTL